MMDSNAFYKISYGLYLLSTVEKNKDNACIINTVIQLTDTPRRIAFAVNKQNFTHDMIARTGILNVSVLTNKTPFALFEKFGFQSGRTAEKFDGTFAVEREKNGVLSLRVYTNAVICAKITATHDVGTHTLFIADVTEATTLSDEPSLTYADYFANVKPKVNFSEQKAEKKKGYVCKICGYVYEGEILPPDFICPLCKHGAEDFEPIE